MGGGGPVAGALAGWGAHRLAVGAVVRELAVADAGQVRAALDEFDAPIVLKSSREEGIKVLRYVSDVAGAEAAFAAVRAASTDGVLAQEYIRGDGYGFSALYWNGRLKRAFMHRRVREWPPTGGASTAADALPVAPALEVAGTNLLDTLAWHGVAMVEFKGDVNGRLALMEINAKFWGSHDVALAAGVNMPADLVTLLEGGTLPPQAPVRPLRFTWPLGGDLWHGLARPGSLPRVLWEACSPAVSHNMRWSDPMPHFVEFVQWARSAPGALHDARTMR